MKKIEVDFSNNKNKKLNGVVHLPGDGGEYPVVIVCHGFKGNKNNDIVVDSCNELAKNGFVGFRFDFAGSGKSQGLFEDFSVNQEVEDLKCAIDFIKNQDFVNKEKIGLSGVSLGGMVSIIETAKNKNVKALVCFAPSIDTRNAREKYERENRIKYFDGYFILDKKFKIKNEFFKEFAMETFSLAKKIKIPILIIQNKIDPTCPTENSIKFINDVESEKDIKILPGSTHIFTKDEQTIALDYALNWFKKRLK
jgi:hypothetical protein